VDLLGAVWTRLSGLCAWVDSVLGFVDVDGLGLFGLGSLPVLGVRVDRTATGLRVVDGLLPGKLLLSAVGRLCNVR
jgi:hypothetical protein